MRRKEKGGKTTVTLLQCYTACFSALCSYQENKEFTSSLDDDVPSLLPRSLVPRPSA